MVLHQKVLHITNNLLTSMAYLRTIFHYYLWEGGGQEEGRYFIIEDFINRGGRGGVKTINEQFIKYSGFFLKSSLSHISHMSLFMSSPQLAKLL